MRSHPNQVRLIIANLYIRVRISRENAATMKMLHGENSAAANRAQGAAWEAQTSLSLAIASTVRADRPGPHLLLEIAKRSAEARKAAVGARKAKAA